MLAAREPSPLDLQSATPSQSPPQPKQRKRRTKMGVLVANITLQQVQRCLDLPSEVAAKRLGIGTTILKRVCRKYGINKWPFNRHQAKRDEALRRQHAAAHAVAVAAAATAAARSASPGLTHSGCSSSGVQREGRWGQQGLLLAFEALQRQRQLEAQQAQQVLLQAAAAQQHAPQPLQQQQQELAAMAIAMAAAAPPPTQQQQQQPQLPALLAHPSLSTSLSGALPPGQTLLAPRMSGCRELLQAALPGQAHLLALLLQQQQIEEQQLQLLQQREVLQRHWHELVQCHRQGAPAAAAAGMTGAAGPACAAAAAPPRLQHLKDLLAIGNLPSPLSCTSEQLHAELRCGPQLQHKGQAPPPQLLAAAAAASCLTSSSQSEMLSILAECAHGLSPLAARA